MPDFPLPMLISMSGCISNSKLLHTPTYLPIFLPPYILRKNVLTIEVNWWKNTTLNIVICKLGKLKC
jgi:hypothetical protein